MYKENASIKILTGSTSHLYILKNSLCNETESKIKTKIESLVLLKINIKDAMNKTINIMISKLIILFSKPPCILQMSLWPHYSKYIFLSYQKELTAFGQNILFLLL